MLPASVWLPNERKGVWSSSKQNLSASHDVDMVAIAGRGSSTKQAAGLAERHLL